MPDVMAPETDGPGESEDDEPSERLSGRGGVDGANGGGANSAAAVVRHRAEAGRLRAEIEALVRQARLLLNGEPPRGGRPPRPHPPPLRGRYAEREQELETVLERADWYRRDIRRLQRELDAAGGNDGRDRDPMELPNLIAEKKRELGRLRRSGEGLDRVAEAQRRAEAEQNALSPQVEEKLKQIKNEVEQQKRLNVKLFADRQRLVGARKKAEEEVRAAESELRTKAAELRVLPRQSGESGGGVDSRILKQLQRDVDILKEALRQDEKKFRSVQKEEESEVESTVNHIAELESKIAEHEAEAAQLRAELREAQERSPRRGRPPGLHPGPATPAQPSEPP